ncbi:MAG: GGDEF domain-containing protein [Nitrospinae bacterium]|nr:GGDEF domain-containing protein [Nitrospinota bacterium]MBL7019944.1 GGDEF domain-containing protein [Nitrospinaceae bacterium]
MNKKSSSGKSIAPPLAFSERIGNLLVSCIQGLKKSMSDDDPLSKKLKGLEGVVRKGVRISPSTELGKEIEEYFDRQILRHEFLVEEKKIVKSMVFEVVNTIKSLVSNSSGFETNITKCVESIESADSIQDIVKLKDSFIGEMKKVREDSRSLHKELEELRKNSVLLAKKLEQSEAQALVDPLTNVLNRAAYNMKMGQMIHEFKRYKEEWALLILDIDHFKKFNDEFGHQLGDKVLKSVAGTVRNSIRVSDQIFRYGGEEFVVLLSRVNVEIASQLAEKICREVEKDYFVHGEKKLKVTISIGGAIVTADDTELSLFERADKAMYEAKNNGRNRIVMDL